MMVCRDHQSQCKPASGMFIVRPSILGSMILVHGIIIQFCWQLWPLVTCTIINSKNNTGHMFLLSDSSQHYDRISKFCHIKYAWELFISYTSISSSKSQSGSSKDDHSTRGDTWTARRWTPHFECFTSRSWSSWSSCAWRSWFASWREWPNRRDVCSGQQDQQLQWLWWQCRITDRDRSDRTSQAGTAFEGCREAFRDGCHQSWGFEGNTCISGFWAVRSSLASWKRRWPVLQEWEKW